MHINWCADRAENMRLRFMNFKSDRFKYKKNLTFLI